MKWLAFNRDLEVFHVQWKILKIRMHLKMWQPFKDEPFLIYINKSISSFCTPMNFFSEEQQLIIEMYGSCWRKKRKRSEIRRKYRYICFFAMKFTKSFSPMTKRERERERESVASMLMREISLSGRPISASYNISALGLRWINIEFMREVQNVYWARNLAGYTQPHTQNPDAWHTDSKLRK